MGLTRASMQDFSNLVGIKFREQDKSVDNSIRLHISLGEVISKLDNNGGSLGTFASGWDRNA